jgi:hypothetical protein
MVIGQLVGAVSRRDMDLDGHPVWRVVQIHHAALGWPLDMLVMDGHLVVLVQIAGEGGQAQRREEGVLDRPLVAAAFA